MEIIQTIIGVAILLVIVIGAWSALKYKSVTEGFRVIGAAARKMASRAEK